MRRTSAKQIANIINGKILAGNAEISVEDVYQDSRLVSGESAFFAINGDAFDGHDFIENVIAKGARIVVVENVEKIKNIDIDENKVCIINVEDTTKALQKLAKNYIASLNCKKIAVTGSTGKTTTRDIIYSVCKTVYKTQKNQGNFNSTVGVPLTILQFREDIEVAVIEMGMDHAGEIDIMADIVRPDVAVITNIGISHMEHFSSQGGIFKAKMEIANYFDKNNTLVVSSDEKFLNKNNLCKPYEIITTGLENNDDMTAYDVKYFENSTRFTIADKRYNEHKYSSYEISLLGKHNVLNAMLAIVACQKIGITDDKIHEGLKNIEITDKRLNVKKGNKFTIIDDTYNASPPSMKVAIEVLSHMQVKRKVAILGDMYELGENSRHEHAEIGKLVKDKLDILYTVGELAEDMQGDRHFTTKEKLISEITDGKLLCSGDAILVKASRGMQLEKIVEAIANLEDM